MDETSPAVNPRVARLHQSIAHVLISRSPLHAWRMHRLLGARQAEPSDAKDTGSILDGLVLGGGGKVTVIEAGDYKTKAAQGARDLARGEGMIPVLEWKWLECQALATSIRARLADKGLDVDASKNHKLKVEWTDPAFGVACAGEIDYFDAPVIWDLKTTKDASRDAITVSMAKYGYHIQRAAYVQAIETLHPELAGRVDMRFAFCEIDRGELVDVTIARPAGTMRQLGAYQWERACRVWRDCLASGVWPGYSDQIVDIEAKPWMMTQEMEEGDHEFEL